MKLKKVILFLTLAFPVLFYLFLQSFGDNKFEVDVYYTEEGSVPYPECDLTYPYEVDLSDYNQLNQSGDGKIIVYGLIRKGNDRIENNLYSFVEKFKDEKEVWLVTIEKDSATLKSKYPNWVSKSLSTSEFLKLGKCILQVNTTLDSSLGNGDAVLILIDGEQRIRGYYDPSKLNEIDRLNTEVQIIRKNS